MTYEPAADVRFRGRHIINWLVYEIVHDRDPDGSLDALAQRILMASTRLAELEAAGADADAIADLGEVSDDLVRTAIDRRTEAGDADNPWRDDPPGAQQT